MHAGSLESTKEAQELLEAQPNKVQILSENVDKQSQNTHLEVLNICQAKVKGSK